MGRCSHKRPPSGSFGCGPFSGKSLTSWCSAPVSQTWAELHEKAFRRLGGTTKVVVLDNLREGVLKTRHLRSQRESAVPRHAATLQCRRATLPRPRSRSFRFILASPERRIGPRRDATRTLAAYPFCPRHRLPLPKGCGQPRPAEYTLPADSFAPGCRSAFSGARARG